MRAWLLILLVWADLFVPHKIETSTQMVCFFLGNFCALVLCALLAKDEWKKFKVQQ